MPHVCVLCGDGVRLALRPEAGGAASPGHAKLKTYTSEAL